MALPEYVAPVLTVAGLPTLIFAITRSLPHAARAVVLLVAGTVAVMTGNEERGKRCLEVLRTLKGKDRDLDPPGRRSGYAKLP